MDKQTAINIHLSLMEPFNVEEKSYYSCLGHALKEARRLTRRNEETGELENIEGSHIWLGAIAYLMILDQIGECYNTSKTIPTVESSFRKAIHYFSGLTQSDSKILYGLRGSLVHNYSLVSRYLNRKGKWDYCYVFELAADNDSELIKQAQEEWDCEVSHIDRDKHSTRINLKKIGDLVEEIYKKICGLHGLGELEINMSPEDLLKCFTFTVYDNDN